MLLTRQQRIIFERLKAKKDADTVIPFNDHKVEDDESVSETQSVSLSTVSSDDNDYTDLLYVPSPTQNYLRGVQPVRFPDPHQLAVIDINGIQDFVLQMNASRKCVTPGCDGILICSCLRLKEMGGSVEAMYACNGCGTGIVFRGSNVQISMGNITTIGASIIVAFIISGCLFSTFYKAMKLALGIHSYQYKAYNTMLKRMHPIVKSMLDEMCNLAKTDMKNIDGKTLGSWQNAVTCADGVWQTRGFHAKNGTFSIRNYMNGALLYYMHLSQKGSDSVIKEDLYEGTSKSMEGYAAREIMKIAKQEGMSIAIQWQDSDASSAKCVQECFPDCRVMICGGHAGKNHLKTLQSYAKTKCPSHQFIKQHRGKFPAIANAVCHCKCKHGKGCGCLSDAFISQARNNFSFILKDSQSPDEFAKRLKSLPKHAQDIHMWKENGKVQCCEFHPLQVCSCGKCKKGEALNCNGKPYSTRYKLTCDFHALMYEIECDNRASMADSLIHPIFKRGHSNWLEASHSVMIRFRSKDVALQRLHYEVSTNLALLQANMTYLWEKKGKEYHWIPELYERLGLPLYEGMEKAYAKVNVKRKRGLDKAKENKTKRRRIELYKKRTKESLQRKEWSKKHGKDFYDTSGCGNIKNDNNSKDQKIDKKPKKISNRKAKQFDKTINIQDTACDSSDDSQLHVSDSEEFHDEDEYLYEMSEDEWEDEPVCICGPLARSHKRECPQNPIHLYTSDIYAESFLEALPAWFKKQNHNDSDVNIVAKVDKESKQPFTPDGEKYCICHGDETLDMVKCDGGDECAIGWFHFACVGLREAPKEEFWYCDECLEKITQVSLGSSMHTTECDGKDEVEVRNDSMDEDCFMPDGEQHCTCHGEDSPNMVWCDGPNCAIGWFHFKCVGLSGPPRTKKWYCSTCSERLKLKGKRKQIVKTEDDCVPLANVTQAEMVTVSGPLPTEEWKCTAVDYIKTWSKMEITKHSQRTRPVTCPSIAPHVRDSVMGDGNCLFRAISKGVSGTEANHLGLRTAMVNFMTDKDNAFLCAKSIYFDSQLLSHPIDTMKQYIRNKKMNRNGWGTDHEIHIIASMLQVTIIVSGMYGSEGQKRRTWVRYEPLFQNRNCMAKSDFKVYIYHNAADHYDHVVPKLN